jgi:hypothetical protein
MPGISKIGTHNQGFDVFSISLESNKRRSFKKRRESLENSYKKKR